MLSYFLLHPLECIYVLNASSLYKNPCNITGSLGHVWRLGGPHVAVFSVQWVCLETWNWAANQLHNLLEWKT